jgi:hypothetical protein
MYIFLSIYTTYLTQGHKRWGETLAHLDGIEGTNVVFMSKHNSGGGMRCTDRGKSGRLELEGSLGQGKKLFYLYNLINLSQKR